MDERLLALVRENYSHISAELLEPLLDFLATASQVSDGDMDRLMIMIAVGLRSIAHPMFKHRKMRELIGTGELIPTLGINSRSISDSLPLARETVRRKVVWLIENGWLRRERGHLHMTEASLVALRPVRAKIQEMAVANYQAVAELSRRESSAPTSP